MPRRSAAAGLGLMLLAAAGVECVQADDGWNPFKEQDQARTSRAGARPRPGDPPQPVLPEPLPPMGGVATRPWLDDRPPGPPEAGRPGTAEGQLPLPGDRPGWRERDDATRTGPQATVDVAPSGAVERRELASPVMTSDGSGLPHDFWHGLDLARAQDMMATLNIPPQSRALNDLWRRLWTSTALEAPEFAKGGPAKGGASYAAIRIEALYRSGLIADLGQALKDVGAEASDPVLGVLAARSRIALGDGAAGCVDVKALARTQAGMPKPIRSELLVLGAWCGASGRDAAAAGLAADLLRAEAVDAPLALAALDALSAGSADAFRAATPKRATLLDYRFLELVQPAAASALIPVAEPALLATIATTAADIKARILAGEAAVRLNILTPVELAAVYRAAPASGAATDPLGERGDPPLRRAALFKAIEAERTPQRKTRLVRSLLDEARRSGHYMQTAAMLATPIAELVPAPEIGWFAETAVEINLAAARYDAARRWAEPQSPAERYGGLRHWLVLVDVADTKWRGQRGEHLAEAEQFAVRGRLGAELMHRLATVLDALDYQIPIPLWEQASRSPQPSGGHLPETGVLSQLQDAAKKKEHGRTVLLAMRTLGPDSGDTAHMIALGDTIRSLGRAGLEADARRLGLEALFSAWPRQASN